MKCPSCGLYHPAFYERCVACGVNLQGNSEVGADPNQTVPVNEVADTRKQSISRVRFGSFPNVQSSIPPTIQTQVQLAPQLPKKRWQMPTGIGVIIAVLILLVCAGITLFFLSQAPSDKRLIDQGKHQLDLGQYAFAVETLKKAVAAKSDDPQAYLVLARAYIGVEQVDQAWDCIVHAQQLGVGVVSDPSLASQLANYYRQKGQYEKAVDLLRPLANANIPGKKAELADMDAFLGDNCVETGKLELAKRAWEEVREIKEGSRYPEAEPRLATIYTRLADLAYNDHEDDKALDYIAKLNEIGENTRNYFLAAEIYERDGKLNEAIDELRKCVKLSPDNHYAESRLAELLSKRGKELIGSGQGEAGYSYFEQASTVDPEMKVPVVALKNTICRIDPADRKPTLAGDVWNSSTKNLNQLSMRVELCDLSTEKILWTKNEHMIDEFVPALPPQATKHFSFTALVSYPAKEANALGFKVYLDGNFYETYPLNRQALMQKKIDNTQSNPVVEEQPSQPGSNSNEQDYSLYQPVKKKAKEKPAEKAMEKAKPAIAPAITPENTQPEPAKETGSPEEKTLKDLEY